MTVGFQSQQTPEPVSEPVPASSFADEAAKAVKAVLAAVQVKHPAATLDRRTQVRGQHGLVVVQPGAADITDGFLVDVVCSVIGGHDLLALAGTVWDALSAGDGIGPVSVDFAYGQQAGTAAVDVATISVVTGALVLP